MSKKSKLVDKDLGWTKMLQRAAEIKNARVKVGVLADDSKGGMHVPGADLTVAEIAAVHEYGTQDGHIPERSFIRSTFDKKREELVAVGKRMMGDVLRGRIGVKQALNMMGSALASEVKSAITDGEGIPPPNAPSTIAAKGSSRPLVDTGRMLNAVTWVIEDGGGKAQGMNKSEEEK